MAYNPLARLRLGAYALPLALMAARGLSGALPIRPGLHPRHAATAGRFQWQRPAQARADPQDRACCPGQAVRTGVDAAAAPRGQARAMAPADAVGHRPRADRGSATVVARQPRAGAALEIQVREFAQRSELVVALRLAAGAAERASQITVYRLVQESLTNIAKYAKATEVTVRLVPQGDAQVRVSVRDNGVGSTPRSRSRVRTGCSACATASRPKAAP